MPSAVQSVLNERRHELLETFQILNKDRYKSRDRQHFIYNEFHLFVSSGQNKIFHASENLELSGAFVRNVFRIDNRQHYRPDPVFKAKVYFQEKINSHCSVPVEFHIFDGAAELSSK